MRPGGSRAEDLLRIQQETQRCADFEGLIRGPIQAGLSVIEEMCADERPYRDIWGQAIELDRWMLAAVERIKDGDSA